MEGVTTVITTMIRWPWRRKKCLLKRSGSGQQNFPWQEDRLAFQAEASVRKARLPFEEMKGSLVGGVESSWVKTREI